MPQYSYSNNILFQECIYYVDRPVVELLWTETNIPLKVRYSVISIFNGISIINIIIYFIMQY